MSKEKGVLLKILITCKTPRQSIESSITNAYGENPTEQFKYTTQLTPEFVQEIISNAQALSASVQNATASVSATAAVEE